MSVDERLPLPRDHVELVPSMPGPGLGTADSTVDVDALADIGAVTDRGIRHHRNEDAVELRLLLAPHPAIVVIVADGVSSSVDPDQASAVAVTVAADTLAASLAADEHARSPDELAALVSAAVVTARTSVAALAAPDAHAESAPACTVVAAVVADGLVVLGWLGDSRAYWVSPSGPALPLTWDDSWAAEAIAAGAAPETAYQLPQAHAITAWLGFEAPAIDPHLVAVAPALVDAGGVLVICSDGLWNYLTDEGAFADTVRYQATLALGAGDASAIGLARRLTDWAIQAGGGDNITVTVIPAAAVAATVR